MLAVAKYPVAPHWVACDDCGGFYDPTETPGCAHRVGLNDTTVCPNCAERLGYALCMECSEWFDDRELIELDGNLLCEDCRDSRGSRECYACNEYVHRSEMHEGADNNDYCEGCWTDRFDVCEDCGELCYREDMRVRRDCIVCENCGRQSQDNFPPARFVDCGGRNELRSDRCFGVELETDACDDYIDLEGKVAFGAKDDCSIGAKEFYSAVLSGDNGLAAIDKLCNFADDNGWEAGRDCGYHLHLDMRSESADSMKAIALAYILTYDVWAQFVTPNRLTGSYARKCRTSADELFRITDWARFADSQYRMEWINFVAYNAHTTFEVRLHHGTLDAYAVKAWVKAHTAFADWASKAGWAKVRNTLLCKDNAGKFDCIAQVWESLGYDDLRDYYENKARRNGAAWAREAVCAG
jgi:hypothetical protein